MLKDKIKSDTIEAMKTKDIKKLEVLRFLYSQIINEEIDKARKQLTDEDIIKLISGQIKKLNESIVAFQSGARPDLVKKAKFEIDILSAYMPKQINDGELEAEIRKIINDNKNITNTGALIGICVKQLSPKADNSRIAQIVQKITAKI